MLWIIHFLKQHLNMYEINIHIFILSIFSFFFRLQVFLRFASKQRDNSIATLEDVIIDDTTSISSSTIQSFVQTVDKANNTFSHNSPSLTQTPNDTSSQTAADLRELPVVDSCTDLVLNVDRPPSSSSNTSSQQDENVFRI